MTPRTRFRDRGVRVVLLVNVGGWCFLGLFLLLTDWVWALQEAQINGRILDSRGVNVAPRLINLTTVEDSFYEICTNDLIFHKSFILVLYLEIL